MSELVIKSDIHCGATKLAQFVTGLGRRAKVHGVEMSIERL